MVPTWDPYQSMEILPLPSIPLKSPAGPQTFRQYESVCGSSPRLWPHLVLLLAEQRELHVLIGRAAQLAAGRRVDGRLLLVATHADQEEEAGDDQRDGDGRDQDEQDLLPGVLRGAWWEWPEDTQPRLESRSRSSRARFPLFHHVGQQETKTLPPIFSILDFILSLQCDRGTEGPDPPPNEKRNTLSAKDCRCCKLERKANEQHTAASIS